MTKYIVSSGYILSGSVLSGGGTSSSLPITSGDTISVLSGGTVEAQTVGSGVSVSVARNGTGSGLTVANGGVVVLQTNASAFNTTILSGGVVSQMGGTFINSGLHVESGGVFDMVYANVGSTAPISADPGAVFEVGGITSSAGITSSLTTNNGQTTLSILGTRANQSEKFIFANASSFQQGTYAANGNTYLNYTVTCFAEGSRILTGEGERAIETISPGDLVSVWRDGQQVQEAVKWVGRARVDLAHHAHVELAAPIRIKANALAEGIPARDLLLSPEHCLVLNGLCVPVKLLVNGGSITRDHPTQPFMYYHIELERHGVLTAEGTMVESYLDTGNRSSFDNGGDAQALFPTFVVNPTSDRWLTEACAPLAQVPQDVAPIWQSLAERCQAVGIALPTPMLMDDPDLHLLVDGKRIMPTAERDNRFIFVVPAGAREVILASRCCIPADRMMPGVRDTRRLGVRVSALSIRTNNAEHVMAADHLALGSGWNDVETDDKTTWRWTDGAGVIPWEAIDGAAVLSVRCSAVDGYPIYDKTMRLAA